MRVTDRVCEIWFVMPSCALDLSAFTTRRQNAATTRQRAGVTRKAVF